MKKLETIVKNASGLTLIEVVLSIVIIATSAVVVLSWQKTSWSQTNATNRLMVAGQVIDKQIETKRMTIAQAPVANFTTFKTDYVSKTVVIIDSTVSPPVSVRWQAWDTLHDPKGNFIKDAANSRNVVQVKLTAWWKGAKKNDTLRVETRIAKNF
jgi:type II secretory pathway pseudopilin PulG